MAWCVCSTNKFNRVHKLLFEKYAFFIRRQIVGKMGAIQCFQLCYKLVLCISFL